MQIPRILFLFFLSVTDTLMFFSRTHVLVLYAARRRDDGGRETMLTSPPVTTEGLCSLRTV